MAKIGNKGLMASRPFHLWAIPVKLNNFSLGFKAVLFLESTILDGLPAGLEKLEIYPPHPQAGIEAGAWAELGKM